MPEYVLSHRCGPAPVPVSSDPGTGIPSFRGGGLPLLPVAPSPVQGGAVHGDRRGECPVGQDKDGIRFIAIEDLARLCCLEKFQDGPFACGRLEETSYLADPGTVSPLAEGEEGRMTPASSSPPAAPVPVYSSVAFSVVVAVSLPAASPCDGTNFQRLPVSVELSGPPTVLVSR